MELNNTEQVCLDYFADNPERKESIQNSPYYKQQLRSLYRETHQYSSKKKETVCRVCGESWYSLKIGYCSGRHSETPISMVDHIGIVLDDEYYLYHDTIAKCEKMVTTKYQNIKTISEEEMVKLHTTYGCSPEILEWIMNDTIPMLAYKEYEAGMEKERQLSRSSQKREIVMVVTN